MRLLLPVPLAPPVATLALALRIGLPHFLLARQGCAALCSKLRCCRTIRAFGRIALGCERYSTRPSRNHSGVPGFACDSISMCSNSWRSVRLQRARIAQHIGGLQPNSLSSRRGSHPSRLARSIAKRSDRWVHLASHGAVYTSPVLSSASCIKRVASGSNGAVTLRTLGKQHHIFARQLLPLCPLRAHAKPRAWIVEAENLAVRFPLFSHDLGADLAESDAMA